MTDYVEIIGRGFPTVHCHVIGDPSIYANIIWDGGDPLPTQTELDAYNVAQPLVDQNVVNGKPAFVYAPAGRPISIEKSTLTFSIKTTGAKNFWLNSANADGSGLGYYIDTKSIIKKVTYSTKAPKGAVTLHFRLPGGTTDISTIVIPNNQTQYSIGDLSAILDANSQLSCYVTSTNQVLDIIVTVDIAEIA